MSQHGLCCRAWTSAILRWTGRWFCLFCHGAFLLVVRAVNADGASPPNQPVGASPIPGYCGLYCVHAAMQVLGRDVEFRSLIKDRYLGSRKGSSVGELALAVEDHNLKTRIMKSMNCGMLTMVGTPVLLHVRSSPSASEYDHWILFLGTNSGNVRIYDGTGKIKTIPMQHLAAIWDGVGLFISDHPIDLSSLYVFGMTCFIALATVVLVIRWLIFRTNSGRLTVADGRRGAGPILRLFGEVGSISLGAIAIVGGMSLFSISGGCLADHDVVAGIQDRHIADWIPTLGVEELNAILSSQEILLIDARHPSDFNAGHIPGAISFPADASATVEKVRETFSAYSKTTPIVIYCQSAGCNYDEYVGKLLISEGYTRLKFFTGGWLEWQQKQSQPR